MLKPEELRLVTTKSRDAGANEAMPGVVQRGLRRLRFLDVSEPRAREFPPRVLLARALRASACRVLKIVIRCG